MSKLPHVGTSIFSVMSKMATEYEAVNLSQGFPDFPVDDDLISIKKSVVTEHFHQYAPMPGSPKLLLEICNMIHTQYKRRLPSEEVLVTAGATEGLYAAISAFVRNGDEVVLLDPCYDSYDPAITLNGGQPIHVPLTDEYLPDWGKIVDAVSTKTRMIIINNPHNPSGRMWKKTDFETLESLVSNYPDLLILSDEVYEFITFENPHLSIHHFPTLHERSIIVSSFGKTFHITGWKMGYMVAPSHLMIEIKKVHQFLVFSVNSIAQETLARYIQHVDVSKLGAFYQEKRDLFQSLIKDSRFKLLPSDGTYFQVADYSEISNQKDTDFVQTLIKEHGIAAIPISVFNASGKDQKHIRFCFAKQDETLIKASRLLCTI